MKSARYGITLIVILAVVYFGWIGIGRGLKRMACGSEERLKVEELSGVRFEVTYLSCDTLAKDEAIRVYAERMAPDGAWFSKWRTKRTLLLRYDPGREDSPLPVIVRTSQSTILISIPEVSSISQQDQEWDGMSVKYNIGQVDYPATGKQP
jgi:hypothetical protein